MSTPLAHTRRYDPIRYRRGTRGFAAVVTTLNGLVVLGLGVVVVPTLGLQAVAASWLVPVAIAAGILHIVAAVGLVRGKAWSRSLVAYLSAAGIGVAAYGILAVATDLDVFGATSTLPADQAIADGVGFLVWMIGSWLVAARFAFVAFAPTPSAAPAVETVPASLPVPRSAAVSLRPLAVGTPAAA
jgi:hypothetical protein